MTSSLEEHIVQACLLDNLVPSPSFQLAVSQVHTYMYMYIYIPVHMYMYMCMLKCTYTCTCTYAFKCTYFKAFVASSSITATLHAAHMLLQPLRTMMLEFLPSSAAAVSVSVSHYCGRGG